jgi:integrase
MVLADALRHEDVEVIEAIDADAAINALKFNPDVALVVCDMRMRSALLLYTGQRRSDVVKIGRQHVHNGVLTIDQGKTEGGEEAHLEIPMHPKLREIIDATPTVGVKTFLVTHFGKPYTPPGFGNWFRELCDRADCPDVSAHGLRKATARRLAEIGCSANQIASITGHASLSEVQRYTKAADRKRMAREAMAKLVEGGW